MPFLAVSRAAALCLLSSTAAFAASPVPVSVVVASSPQPAIQIVGHAARTLPAAEFAALRGEYRLANGGSLAIEGARHRPVVLGDRAPVALVPVGPGRLVSADGRLRLDVRSEANGLVSGLVLQVPPELL